MVIFGAIVLLVLLAVQYPLSTSWPIGGDAASYIVKADKLLDSLGSPTESLSLLTSSRYPLSIAVLAGSSALPLSWPDRYVWMMASAQILAGLSLGWLLFRLVGWQAAATGIFIWSLTTTGYNLQFEDGTFAQLLSLVFLLLFFERVAAGSWWGAGLALLAVMASHPLSGLLVLLLTVLCLPAWWFMYRRLESNYKWTLKVLTLLAVAGLGLIAMRFNPQYLMSWSGEGSQGIDLIDMLRSTFGFWLILSVLGWWIMQKVVKSEFALVFVNTFVALAVFFALNNHFGLDVWVVRFRSYFILAVALCAAIAFPKLVKTAFRSRISIGVFVTILLLSMSLDVWQGSARIYDIYESQEMYKRLSGQELESLEWAANNLPPDSVIVSSQANRHSEWIPIVVDRDYHGLSDQHDFWSDNDEEMRKIIAENGFTHIVFFQKREDLFGLIADYPDRYPLIFRNDGALIYSL